MLTRPHWYSDHPSACQCDICSNMRNRWLSPEPEEETKDAEEQIMNTETNKFGFKMSKNRLIFGVVLLAIVSVALIMVVISLSQDKATLQQDVDVKAQNIADLSQDVLIDDC